MNTAWVSVVLFLRGNCYDDKVRGMSGEEKICGGVCNKACSGLFAGMEEMEGVVEDVHCGVSYVYIVCHSACVRRGAQRGRKKVKYL